MGTAGPAGWGVLQSLDGWAKSLVLVLGWDGDSVASEDPVPEEERVDRDAGSDPADLAVFYRTLVPADACVAVTVRAAAIDLTPDARAQPLAPPSASSRRSRTASPGAMTRRSLRRPACPVGSGARRCSSPRPVLRPDGARGPVASRRPGGFVNFSNDIYLNIHFF